MPFLFNQLGIGTGQPVFFIAEAGVNHNGSVDLGKKLIEVAREAGASAVKFQSFKAENIVTRTAPKSSYHVATTGGSVVNAIKSLNEVNVPVKDAYVIVDRMEGATESLAELGVKMHSILNILQISEALFEQNLIDEDVLKKVKKQISK